MRERRPSFLTVDLVDQLIRELRTGKQVDEVCKACKISKGVFYKWLTQGQNEPNTVFAYLLAEYDALRNDGYPKLQ